MNLPKFALENKAVVLVGTLLLVAFGVLTFMTAPRKEDPQFTIRDGFIVTPWLGATATEVEQLVTDPLELTLAGVKTIRKIDSTSYAGVSFIQITTIDDVTDANAVWDKVRRELKLTEPRLPAGCGSPMLNDHISQAAAMILCLYQDPSTLSKRRYTPRELEDYARLLRDRIMDLRPVTPDGNGRLVPVSTAPSYVERVDIFGAQQEVIYVETDVTKWSELEVTGEQLATYLRLRNMVVPGGSIETDVSRFNIKLEDRVDAVSEIGSTVVARVATGTGGQKPSALPAMLTQSVVDADGSYAGPVGAPVTQNVPVTLTDLELDVTRDYLDPPLSLTRYSDAESSKDCVVLAFALKDGVNIVDLDESMTHMLATANDTFLPPDVLVSKASDQPVAVNKKVSEVVSNVISSIAVVILVLIFMAGLRTSIIAAIAIPAIMLIALGLMTLFGVVIEQISLAALIIALGILVDNTIQVCDNTGTMLNSGADRRTAAIQGPGQISFAILIATGTIIVAFLPMTVFLKGSMKEYIFSLPVVVCLALGVGWVFAVTVTTIMAYYGLKPAKAKSADTGPKKPGLYQKICLGAVKARWLTIGVSYALLVLVISLPMKTSFFPLSDRNQFVVDVYLPDSSPIARTSQAAARVEEMIRRLGRHAFIEGDLTALPEEAPRLQSLCTFVGSGGPFNYPGLYPKASEPNYACMWVNTTTGDDVPGFLADLRRAVSEGLGEVGAEDYLAPIPGVRVVPHSLVLGTPVISPVDVRLLGPRLGGEQVLREYGERIKDAMRDCGLAWDVHDSWGEYGRQLDVDVNEEKAVLSGVTNAAISLSMNAYYSGHPLALYRERDRQIPVMLRLPPSQRRSLDELNAIHVEGFTGKVPLESVATIRRSWEPAKINRYQRERNMSVRCRPEPGVLFSEVIGAIQPDLDQIAAELPPGYRIEQGGIAEEAAKGAKMNGTALLAGAILIFFLLVVQFSSVLKPFMIFLTLPLAAGGGLVGLLIMKIPLGFMETVGFLALFGIVLSAAILLIEFSGILVGQKLAAGEGLAGPGEKSFNGLTRSAFQQCLAEAGQLRLMPILMTTLTTVGGLLSLMFVGGPLFKGLATVIVVGLSIGTLFTLFVLPAIIAVFVETLGVKLAEEPAAE
jgi:multidrug efflux pump subunit AcrB